MRRTVVSSDRMSSLQTVGESLLVRAPHSEVPRTLFLVQAREVCTSLLAPKEIPCGLLLFAALRAVRAVLACTSQTFLFLLNRFMLSLHSIAVLPQSPVNGSPVPWLTSLYHKAYAGPYGDRSYPGNCSGELIKDLLLYFKPKRVLDPMTGSGTCADVCRELGIECVSFDIRDGNDACVPSTYKNLGTFDFIWVHPPYWRQKTYSDDVRDLSVSPSLPEFLWRYAAMIFQLKKVLTPGGRLAILMGDYSDREAGYCPLVYHTQRICFDFGLRQSCTQIIRFSHGASSSKKTYRSSFIPGLHDVCTIVEKIAPHSEE